MLPMRYMPSYDADFLKHAKTTCPLSLAFLWFSHSLKTRKGKGGKGSQLLFTEMSGIATVTPGHSRSVRYHIQSYNSRGGTEVGRPAKPVGIPLRPDLRGPPRFAHSKYPSAQFPCHTHCFHDASALPVQVLTKSQVQDVT